MGISKIGQLFLATNIDPLARSREPRADESATTATGNHSTPDAVVVAQSVRHTHQALINSESVDRQAKIEQLKSAVKDGKYKVDSKAVATAVWRELA